MPGGLNRVMLLGDLAGDPAVYVTRAGQVVLTLRLGTTESYRDPDGVARERVSYHQVVVVGKRADALSKVLRRGARVFVEGSLRTTAIDGRDGKKRTRTEVVAAEVLFAGVVAPSPAPAEEAPARLPLAVTMGETPKPPAQPVNESLPFR